MTHSPFHSKFTERVLTEIKSGKVKMRPKVHFLLKTMLVVFSAIAISLFVLYVMSLITFAMRLNGSWFGPEFGMRGLGIFLASIPQLLIFISIVLIVVLEILVRHFSFGHRLPILYSLLAVILFAPLGGFIIDKVGLHTKIFRSSENGRAPAVVKFYHSCCAPELKEAHRGMVRDVTTTELTIENSQGEIVSVFITPDTRFPLGTGIEIGDEVVVMGDYASGTLQAFGIRKVGDDFDGFPIHFPKNQLPKNEIMPMRN